ncbi:MAG TPA: LysM peptidoglycan-binding domain-containing protein [Levilinea sp.]|nr:LysM peptidoglycan-binding domain-containing protein [Levilinea sp.]
MILLRFLPVLFLLPLAIPTYITRAQAGRAQDLAAVVVDNTLIQPAATLVGRTPTQQDEIVIQRATPANDGSVIHRVRAGETLWTIAEAYGTSVDELIALNNLRAANPVIFSGQNLVIWPAYTPTPTVTITATPPPSPTATATRRPTRTPHPTDSPTPQRIEQQTRNLTLDNRILAVIIVLAVGVTLFLLVTFGIKDKKQP